MKLGPLFVGMALLYPWATKEYVLWSMTLGQVVLYYNLGIEMKFGDLPETPQTMVGHSAEEIRAVRDELRRKYGAIE